MPHNIIMEQQQWNKNYHQKQINQNQPQLQLNNKQKTWINYSKMNFPCRNDVIKFLFEIFLSFIENKIDMKMSK